jgi:hypothetical protein
MKYEHLLGIWEFGENQSREGTTFLMAVKQVTRVHSSIPRQFESKDRLVHCVHWVTPFAISFRPYKTSPCFPGTGTMSTYRQRTWCRSKCNTGVFSQ